MYVQSYLFFIVDEQSEVVDSAAIERDVMGKGSDLKNKEASIKQDKSVIKTQAGEFSNFSRGYHSYFFWKGMETFN